MKCQGCGYALWNLPDRVCPECGLAFLPSQFEFVVNSIRFQCPHCLQSYYGTGPRGHLVPQQFACVSCGVDVHMDEMVLLPTEGVKEEATEVRRLPWLERHKGFFRGWLGTVGATLSRPSQSAKGSEPVTAGSAFWFAIMNAVPPFVMLVATALVLLGAGGPAALGMLIPVGVLGVAYIVFIAVWGLAAHLCLWISGPKTGGLGRTYRAICLSSAPVMMCIVPCLGPYMIPIAVIWWVVLAVLMLMPIQGVRWPKAFLACGLLPLLLAAGLLALVIYGVSSAVRVAQAIPQQLAAQNLASATTLAAGLQTVAGDHGQYPGHGLHALLSGGGGPRGVLLLATMSAPEKTPVAGSTLDRVYLLPHEQRAAMAGAAADALPVGVVAHRLGDVVFTYHGATPVTADPGLWLFVVWPDPDQNPAGSWPPDQMVNVGKADGSITSIPVGNFDATLTVQNALRERVGMPALPHPRTVTHSAPAVAPGGEGGGG